VNEPGSNSGTWKVENGRFTLDNYQQIAFLRCLRWG
jgi:hypothetical protein